MSSSGDVLNIFSQNLYRNYNQKSSLSDTSPFMSFESRLIPHSLKEAARLLCFSFLTDANINAVIESTVGYPLTYFAFLNDPSKEVKEFWRELLRKVGLKHHNFNIGIDYFLYGNAAGSIFEPFDRYMTCSGCNNEYNTSTNLPEKWKWEGNKFKISCPKCKTFKLVSKVTDKKIKNTKKLISGINLIRWNFFDLEVSEHPYSGEKTWWHVVPSRTIKEFNNKNLDFISKTPIKIIEAIQKKLSGKSEQARIKFTKEEIKTIQRPLPSMPNGQMSGFGLPLAIAALRDLFFKNTIRRAQAVILQENIVPFRIVSPAQIGVEPHLVDNERFKDEFDKNFQAWKINPQHAMISTIPAQIQQMGGDSKALNMFAEIQIVNQDIIKAMNTSKALMDGDMTFSGGSVALRMFENSLMTYIEKIQEMNDDIIEKIANILGIPAVKIKYVPFKMGEDPQTKAALDGLNQRGKLSDESLLTVYGYDAEQEAEKVKKETIRNLKNQQIAQAEAQVRAQKVMEYMQLNEPNSLAIGGMPIDPNQVSDISAQLQGLDPQQSSQIQEQMQQQNPYLAKTVQNRMDLSPQSAMNFFTDLQQTPPELQQDRMDDLKTSDPIKSKIMEAVSEVLNPNQRSIRNIPLVSKPFKPIKPVAYPSMLSQRVPRSIA